MKPVRAACGVFVALCMSTLVYGNWPSTNEVPSITDLAYFPNPLIRHTGNVDPRDTIDAIVKDATADGGSVVLCRNNHCLDLATHKDMGQAQDGYYVVFDRNLPGYEELLKKYQERIQNWMQQSD
jgi:hypothetical protein